MGEMFSHATYTQIAMLLYRLCPVLPGTHFPCLTLVHFLVVAKCRRRTRSVRITISTREQSKPMNSVERSNVCLIAKCQITQIVICQDFKSSFLIKCPTIAQSECQHCWQVVLLQCLKMIIQNSVLDRIRTFLPSPVWLSRTRTG